MKMRYKSIACMAAGAFLSLLGIASPISTVLGSDRSNLDELQVREYSAALKNKDILERRSEIELKYTY